MTIDENLIAKMSADKEFVAQARRTAAHMRLLGGPDLSDCSDEEIVRITLEMTEGLRQLIVSSGVSLIEAAEAMISVGRAGTSCDALRDALDGFARAVRDLNADPSA